MTWAAAKRLNSITMLLEMVARHRLAIERALIPGYFRINLLEMYEDGEMFVTKHQAPLDVSFEAFIHHFHMLRPAESEENRRILRGLMSKLDKSIGEFKGETRDNLQQVRKATHAGCFTDAAHSERRTWYYVLHRKNESIALRKADDLPMPSKWKRLHSAEPLTRVKEASAQEEFPILARVSFHAMKTTEQMTNKANRFG